MSLKTFQNIAFWLIVLCAALWMMAPPPEGWKPGMTGTEARTAQAAMQPAFVAQESVLSVQDTQRLEPLPEPETPAASPTMSVEDTLPEGQFYTRKRVSMSTKNGVVGIRQYTYVTLLERDGSRMTVTDGRVQVITMDTALTNSRKEIAELERCNVYTPAPAEPETLSAPVSIVPDDTAAREEAERQAMAEQRRNAAVAALEAQVCHIDEEIQRLENRKGMSRINANGPVITRLRMQRTALERQLAALR